MEKKNLLELGGTIDLIATAVCDFDTPLKHYSKGDIVLNLQDVVCMLANSVKRNNATSGSVDLSYSTLTISEVRCPYVPLERQIWDLLSQEPEKTRIVESEEAVCVQEGLIILKNYVPLTDTIRVEGIDMTTVTITSSEENKTTILQSSSFDNTAETDEDGQKYYPYYKVQYETEEEHYKIMLDSRPFDIPYLSLQIKVSGNADKRTSTHYIKIDKSRLIYSPMLRFGDNNVTYCDLSFVVIDSGEKPFLVM